MNPRYGCRARRGARLFPAVGMMVVFTLFLSTSAGCAKRPPTPPGATAEAAIETISPCVVNGVRGKVDWLSARSDGSIEATGYLDGSTDTAYDEQNNEYTFVHLLVPQTVSGVTFYHALPLVANSRTRISSLGKKLKLSAVLGPNQRYWVRARFSFVDIWLHADSLEYISRKVQVPSGLKVYPPGLSSGEDQLRQDAELKSRTADPWIDVSTKGGPFPIRGYFDGSWTYDPKEHGLGAGIHLSVPDRMGPAPIYHLVQVYFKNESDVPPESSLEETPKPRLLQVVLRGDRVVSSK